MIPTYYDAPNIFDGSVPMRGDDQQTGWMFSYVSPEGRVPADHPLRAIRRMTDAVFERLSPRFDRLYSKIGRPSIAPEKLLRALLLQGLYTVRSEALLMEQLQYNCCFAGLSG
jgi:transposase